VRKELGIKARLALVDADKIALETLGVNIVNTTMIGAMIKATGVISTESVKEPLEKRFGRLAERNIKAMERAVKETKIGE
jgi:pyruvate ferredoxin oxidoreductase gamma subunit